MRQPVPTTTTHSLVGVLAAGLILLAWGTSLVLALHSTLQWASPLTYLWMLLQTHLYTGLFITAHDAMHGTLAPGRPGLNRWLGRTAAALFAFNSYDRLLPRHHRHHRQVGTAQDPDYHPGNFVSWYISFLSQYITWWQLLLMAITFNLLFRLFFPLQNVILYWMLPAILSTLQLFYFGTYLPHRGHHAPDNPHKARSQPRQHVLAFLSCYFFGYHYEHHASPGTPWWHLPGLRR